MIKSDTTKTTYCYGTIQYCYESDSKAMFGFYFLCLLSIRLLMQGSTLSLNTTDNNVRKV